MTDDQCGEAFGGGPDCHCSTDNGYRWIHYPNMRSYEVILMTLDYYMVSFPAQY